MVELADLQDIQVTVAEAQPVNVTIEQSTIAVVIQQPQINVVVQDSGALNLAVQIVEQRIDVRLVEDQAVYVTIVSDPSIAVAAAVAAQAALAEALALVKMIVVTETQNFEIDATDAGKMILSTSATAVSATIQLESETGDLGEIVCIAQKGAGMVTLVPAIGVTLNTADGLTTRTIDSVIGLVRTAKNEWQLMGDLGYYV